ncbi:hypothetical protein A1QO_03930 [Vibrio genomosp. F10 str. ZF-129]|uniref:Uncharacterized protein n=1 Tax=Vibrio genomosp. F10 str. ZF-129 TaxID=1187848 RepID=A0A1E5BIN6_9VIBR|nr:hypothetical protein [Vibrio genomosp. F10]OEE37260.1 hypothetical protein A1QO_03930 [Vibrio genomosp. F10 str. ZF-129]
MQLDNQIDNLLFNIELYKSKLLQDESSLCPEHRFNKNDDDFLPFSIKRRTFKSADTCAVKIHSFLHIYCSTPFTSNKASWHILTHNYPTLVKPMGDYEMVILDDPEGSDHRINIGIQIGLFMKEALVQGLDDWVNLTRRLRGIAETLEPDFSLMDSSFSLIEVMEQELQRHLKALAYYYQKHLCFDPVEMTSGLEISLDNKPSLIPCHIIWTYNWDQLCWKLRKEKDHHDHEKSHSIIINCFAPKHDFEEDAWP